MMQEDMPGFRGDAYWIQWLSLKGLDAADLGSSWHYLVKAYPWLLEEDIPGAVHTVLLSRYHRTPWVDLGIDDLADMLIARDWRALALALAPCDMWAGDYREQMKWQESLYLRQKTMPESLEYKLRHHNFH